MLLKYHSKLIKVFNFKSMVDHDRNRCCSGRLVIQPFELYEISKSFIFKVLFLKKIRCPEKKIATPFTTHSKGYVEAEIPMYRFAEYNVVNIQCDILVCKGQPQFYLSTCNLIYVIVCGYMI